MEEERKDWYGSWTEIGVGNDDGPLQASLPFSGTRGEPAVLTWSTPLGWRLKGIHSERANPVRMDDEGWNGVVVIMVLNCCWE